MLAASRQVGRVDLHHRPDDDQGPVRARVGQRGEQLQVHPLVDHAVEAQARTGQRGLVGRLGHGRRGRLAKWARSTLEGKGWMLACAVALGLVEAVAAGEDHVGAPPAARAPGSRSSGGANLKLESSSMQS